MKRRLRSAHHAAAYIDTQAALVLSGPDVYKDWNTNIIDFESFHIYKLLTKREAGVPYKGCFFCQQRK